jgi:hypothetical protein
MEEDYFKERRKHIRIKAIFNVKFLNPPNLSEVKGFTNDISVNGLGLFTNSEINPKSYIEVKLENPLKKSSLYLKGTVAWSKAIDFSTYRIGVELEETDWMAINELLET